MIVQGEKLFDALKIPVGCECNKKLHLLDEVTLTDGFVGKITQFDDQEPKYMARDDMGQARWVFSSEIIKSVCS